MTLFPIFFAEIENDLRRVLAYSLNNQLGFMVVGIGVGTELALNGTASHAFAHILYKSLLFMSVGAVLFRTGTSKASELGGLYKTMPLTALFCLIGAASISAFPLFSGFVTKSLILDATATEHYPVIWGVLPNFLYSILPYEVNYKPYTMSHVISQMQLLCFALLAFTVIMKIGLHPPEVRGINLDTDWIYRKLLPSFIVRSGYILSKFIGSTSDKWKSVRNSGEKFFSSSFGPTANLAKIFTSGAMILWIVVIFSGALIIVLF